MVRLPPTDLVVLLLLPQYPPGAARATPPRAFAGRRAAGADRLQRRVPGELRGSAGGVLGCVRQGGAGLGVILSVGHVAGDEVA